MILIRFAESLRDEYIYLSGSETILKLCGPHWVRTSDLCLVEAAL